MGYSVLTEYPFFDKLPTVRKKDNIHILTTMQKKTAKPVRSRTEREYDATLYYLQQWQNDKLHSTFANSLLAQNMAQATRIKHLRQAGTLIKRKVAGVPAKLTVEQLGSLSPNIAKPPLKFTDDDFQTLYDAFIGIEHPTFIQSEERHRFWQCVVHFATVTALRREAILGLTIDNVNFKELFITIPANIDKKDTERYKPITKELADEILALRRFYDNKMLVPGKRKLIFPWTHGNKRWYKCWHIAEDKVGKRFHLHDLKRFSGELALRAGATPLELQQHMDHASLTTTMKHYCRPQTRELLNRIVVPIPRKSLHKTKTPLFTEPELMEIIRETVINKLASLGIENMPGIVLDAFGNPFIDHRTSEEQVSKAKEQGLRIYREGGAS